MAFIFSEIFDEFVFHPEPPAPPRIRAQPARASKIAKDKRNHKEHRASDSDSSESEDDDAAKDSDWRNSEDQQQRPQNDEDDDNDEANNAAFEIPLNTLIECLNVFGTAGPSTGLMSGSGGTGGKRRGWQRANEHNDGSDNEYGARDRNQGDLDVYFAAAAGGLEKRTSMRMTYFGAGYPLTLIVLVCSFFVLIIHSLLMVFFRAEDASGPTTTCEITTFEPEPQLELEFDSSRMLVPLFCSFYFCFGF